MPASPYDSEALRDWQAEDRAGAEEALAADQDVTLFDTATLAQDPKPLVEWPSQMAPLVPQLRRLQYAANGLNLREFAEALGWDPADRYVRSKFSYFQALGGLHVFDDNTLQKAIEYYEAQHA